MMFEGLGPGDGQALVSQGPVQDVAMGLQDDPKWLSGKYFYDSVGLALFQKITKSPTYPVTREERAIFETHARAIAQAIGPQAHVLELGVGTSIKITPLLVAMADLVGHANYWPNDIDEHTLSITSARVQEVDPRIRIQPMTAEFDEALRRFSEVDGDKVVAMLGGSIGNIEPPEQLGLLERIRDLSPDGDLLIGFDAIRDPAAMELAYDDPDGITAAFNRNIITNLNRSLDGDNDPTLFDHRARWNSDRQRMELELVARQDVVLSFGALEQAFPLQAGEAILTQVSYKYAPRDVEALAGLAGYEIADAWNLSPESFTLYHLRPRTPS